MKTTIPIVIGLALLVALVVKEPRPDTGQEEDIGQEEKSIGALAVEYEKEAADIPRLEAAKRAIAVAEAFSDSWSMAEFQSADIEFFQYIEEIDSRLVKIGEGQVAQEILITGKPKYWFRVPLDIKMWVDLKTHIKVDGHPELYLRARIDQDDRYIVGLVRLSDVVPPILELAKWTETVEKGERTADGDKVKSRQLCKLMPGQSSAELPYQLENNNWVWSVDSDANILVNVNGTLFASTKNSDVDARISRRKDGKLFITVTRDKGSSQAQTPVEFVCVEKA